jgi:hypothetical protein
MSGVVALRNTDKDFVQGDQIGRMFAYLGKFMKITVVAEIFLILFSAI